MRTLDGRTDWGSVIGWGLIIGMVLAFAALGCQLVELAS